MRKFVIGVAAAVLAASPALAGGNTLQISGQGTIEDGRQFVLSATVHKDGSATGHATLINRNFSAENGSNAPYIANIRISCVNVVDGEIYLGGVTTSTNDPNLDDAVYFAVSDDGNRLSRAFFFDGDPATTGDPGLCQFNQAGDFPLENVIRGNIKIR